MLNSIRMLLAVALLSLGACGAKQVLPPAPQTPDQALYLAHTTYTGLLDQANVYASMPFCSATVKLPCADPKVVIQAAQAVVKVDTAMTLADKALAAYKTLSSPTVSDTTKLNTAISAVGDALTTLSAMQPQLKTGT